ncbi:potassium channel family protein [Aurantivibrio infirmus]
MFITIIINIIIVMLVVLIHYEALSLMSKGLVRFKSRHRIMVVAGVLGAILAHVTEIWVFGFGFYFMLHMEGLGELQGNFDGSIVDSVYFSITNYTSLGYGDIEPLGYIRFLASMEALTGLVLITWSASFMFIEMQKFWKNN